MSLHRIFMTRTYTIPSTMYSVLLAILVGESTFFEISPPESESGHTRPSSCHPTDFRASLCTKLAESHAQHHPEPKWVQGGRGWRWVFQSSNPSTLDVPEDVHIYMLKLHITVRVDQTIHNMRYSFTLITRWWPRAGGGIALLG